MSRALIALCALALAGCAASRESPRSAPVVASSLSTATQRAIDRFASEIDSLRAELRIPGLAAAVVRERSVLWAQGFGYANREWRVRATPDTPFHLASLTKPVAATLVMQLVDRGAVGLYDPLTKWGIRLGQVAQVWNLLSHTSGAGSTYSYNGDRYALLETIIQRATGLTFRDGLYEKVLKPLGMSETAANDRPRWGTFLGSLGIGVPERQYARVYTRLARPYRVTEKLAVTSGSYSLEQSTSAGLMSSVLDLAKLDIALDKGTLMRAATRELMWRPMAGTSDVDGSLFYGLGWFVQYAYGTRLVWHHGIWPPSVSALWLKIPDEGLSLILLANTDGLSAPFPLAEGDVLTSAFALAFARSFVYPRRAGRDLPAVSWKAPEAELVATLGRITDPTARDLLERELWSRRQVYANAGRWDLANRLLRVARAAFPGSERATDRRFASVYAGSESAGARGIGVWGMVRWGRFSAVWLALCAASLGITVRALIARSESRRGPRLLRLPAVAAFGPIALAAYWGVERWDGRRIRGPRRFVGRALIESVEEAARSALSLVLAAAVIALYKGHSARVIGVCSACAAALGLELAARRLRGTAGRSWAMELLVGTLGAAVGAPIFLLLLGMWFDTHPDAGSPIFWLATAVAAAAAIPPLFALSWWTLVRSSSLRRRGRRRARP